MQFVRRCIKSLFYKLNISCLSRVDVRNTLKRKCTQTVLLLKDRFCISLYQIPSVVTHQTPDVLRGILGLIVKKFFQMKDTFLQLVRLFTSLFDHSLIKRKHLSVFYIHCSCLFSCYKKKRDNQCLTQVNKFCFELAIIHELFIVYLLF